MSTLGQMAIFVPYRGYERIIKHVMDNYSPNPCADLDDYPISHVRACLRNYLKDKDDVVAAIEILNLLELQR